MISVKPDRKIFLTNPAGFLKEAIREFVISTSTNRLTDYNNEPVCDEPLVGFANGDDPIFQQFQNETIIGESHLTPRDALTIYLKKQGKKVVEKQPNHISIIAIGFPFTYNIRLRNRQENVMSSKRWQQSYFVGYKVCVESAQYVATLLETFGYQAVAPVCSQPPKKKKHSMVIVDNFEWSEKHIAYAAGLGSFGHSTNLITSRGTPVHFVSVVTDLELPSTPRSYDDHHAYCLYYGKESCHQCIKRCPSGALSVEGHNPKKCLEYAFKTLPKIIKNMGKEDELGEYPMCSLCLTNLPCEDRIP